MIELGGPLSVGPGGAQPGGRGDEVKIGELVNLCAVDGQLYSRTFFPRAFRQDGAPFHKDLWNVLEDRRHHRAALSVFRGGAKTTLLRAFTSKRIAYGISNTIMFVSNSQDHSIKSIEWLKKQVEFNKLWASIFKLSKGSKWSEEFIKIQHGIYNREISVVAVGITGQIRGLNIEDFRPDLIVVDDPCDEENTGTPDQRRKMAELFFGALEKSMAPVSESPAALMALLQTPLQEEDLLNLCLKDPQWAARTYPCFTPDGESAWPTRWSTETLLADKEAHIRRNHLSLWLREMECRITSPETSLFRSEWLQHYDILPEGMAVYIGIDPTPPPSEREIQGGLRKKDSEVITAIGVHGSKRFVLEIASSKGHTPEWTITTLFRMIRRWQPMSVRVEGVAYQRTLKWLIEQEMKKRGVYFLVNSPPDNRKKAIRIQQAFSGLASSGNLFIDPTMTTFQEQFIAYPNVAHDDELDAVAMALDEAAGVNSFGSADVMKPVYEPLSMDWMVAP